MSPEHPFRSRSHRNRSTWWISALLSALPVLQSLDFGFVVASTYVLFLCSPGPTFRDPPSISSMSRAAPIIPQPIIPWASVFLILSIDAAAYRFPLLLPYRRRCVMRPGRFFLLFHIARFDLPFAILPSPLFSLGIPFGICPFGIFPSASSPWRIYLLAPLPFPSLPPNRGSDCEKTDLLQTSSPPAALSAAAL